MTGGILLLILLIGFSRIYRGAHWPSDVLGGYALGGAYYFLVTAVYAWIEGSSEAQTDQAGTKRDREGKRVPK